MAKRRAIHEHERDVVLAWNSANLTAAASVGKLPDLKDVLKKIRPVEQVMTRSQHKQVMEMISGRYGIPLQRTRLIRRDVTAHG